MPIQVRAFGSEDGPQWDAFVHRHPHGTPFHLAAWKLCMEDTFGYRSMYLIATEGGELQGVLPLFLVQNLMIKKALISSPFAVYGGALAESREVLHALIDHAQTLGDELGVEYIELRNGYPEQAAAAPNVDRYATFTKVLSDTEDGLLETIPKKTRNMVRKALKTPFTTRIETENIENFERLHSTTMRRLGTPCFPKEHFRKILQNFRGMVDIREVRLKEQVMAVSMNFYFRQTMHTYYAAADPEFNALAPNTYMYFDHLLWAGQNGYKTFEFGRSKRGTGAFEFKTHWGTEMRALPYHMLLLRGQDVPNYSPTNSKFSLAINVWKRLPMPVTRMLGPRLIGMFP
jgi:FemAB-related protein (PEP-CTERM system-associated)